MGLDLEFAAVLATKIALIYGVALPIILPIAALSLVSHLWVFGFLIRTGFVRALPCAAPPPAEYLFVSLLLQAAIVAWFFASTAVGHATTTAVVGTLVFCPVLYALCRYYTLCRRCSPTGRGQTVNRGQLGMVLTDSGVRLTEIGDNEGGHFVLLSEPSD